MAVFLWKGEKFYEKIRKLGFFKDMINEKNIVASDEFLEEETEVLDNGENRLSNSYGTKKADS